MNRHSASCGVMLPVFLVACGGVPYSIEVLPSTLDITAVYGQTLFTSDIKVRFHGDGIVIGPPVGTEPLRWVIPVVGDATDGVATIRLIFDPAMMEMGKQSGALRFVTGKQDGSVVVFADLTLTATKTPAFFMVPDHLSVTANDGKNRTTNFTVESSPPGAFPVSIAPITGIRFSKLTAFTGESITVGPDVSAAALPTGNTTQTITASVEAEGIVAHAEAQLDFRLRPRRIYVARNGIALVHGPGHSRLSSSFTVFDGAGQTPAITATADQPWLTVSHDGLAVTISADPTGLAPGQHFANVAIASSDAGVTAGDTVRVGLYVFDTPASSEIVTDTSGLFGGAIEVDPVRPLLYHINHNLVRAFHVYDNKVAFEIDLGIQQGTLSGLAASLDGRHLYAAVSNSGDRFNVYDIDLDSRIVQRRLSYPDSPPPCSFRLLYMRIRGRELLVDHCLNGWVDLSDEATRPASLFGSADTMVLGYNSAEVIVSDSYCSATAYEIDVGVSAMSLLHDVSKMVLEDCAIGGPVMRILRSSRDGTVVVAQGAGKSTTWKYRSDDTYAEVAGTVSDGAQDLLPLDDGRAYVATSNSVSLVSAAGQIAGTISLGASVFPDLIILSSDGGRLFANAFNDDQQRGEVHVVDAIH